MTAMNNNNRPVHSTAVASKFIRRKLALAIASQLLWAGQAIAGPTGGQVVGGAGSIEQGGRATTIRQDTDRLAVDWQTFDVAVDEQVNFIQPGQSSVALNRILGSNGSQIQGQINANGHVILVNPHGIVFSKSATVNAGGLIASGLQINPDDFINGDLVFKGLEGTDGTVINSGILNASLGGNVALLGKSVDNQGLISANLGRVQLAAGEEAVLTFDQQGLLGVQIDKAVLQEELGGKAAVSNSGTITAEEGQILLNAGTAKDVFSQAVNWGDQKRARSVTYNDDGSFTLGGGGDVVNSGTLDTSGEAAAGSVVALGENVTNSGTVRADVNVGRAGKIELHAKTTVQFTEASSVSAIAKNSGKGGDIKLQGENIGLFDQSSVDASGVNGGGTVLVGGDREGLNKQVRNADFVYIGDESGIDVSAGVSGDGGRLILYAEDTARIYGSLSARGGALLGDGGFIETSGKKGFDFDGIPDVAARQGVSGYWLIDPFNIDIVEDFDGNVSGESPFSPTGRNARLRSSILQGALNAGANITVQTGGDGNEDGNITVSVPVGLTANVESTLNLIAHNDINIEANITAADNIEVADNGTITADRSPSRKLNINLHANTAGGDGSINIANDVIIVTGGGNFTIGAIENDLVNFAVAGARDVNFSGATIDVVGAYTNTQLNALFPTSTGSRDGLAPSGRIAINASQDAVLGVMQVKGREREDDPAKIDIVAGRDITLAASLGYDNNPTEVFEPGDISNDGYSTLRLTAERNIALNGNIEFLHASTEFRAEHQDRLHIRLAADDDNDGVGNVVLGNNNGDGEVRIATAGGDFVVDSAVDVVFDNDVIITTSVYGGGDIDITASGDVTLGTMASYFNFGGRTDGNLADNLRAMNIDVTADGNITLARNFSFNGIGGDLVYSDSNPSPSFTLTAGNNLTLGGQVQDNTADADAFDYLNVVLTADADATANGDAGNEGRLSIANGLYTGGGNLSLSGAVVALNGNALNTDWGNPNTGTSIGSSGGHILIESSSNLALGNVRTDDNCAALLACGNLLVRSRNPLQTPIDVVNGNNAIQMYGSISFDVGAGDVVVNNVRSAPDFETPNDYQNELIIASANDVTIEVDNKTHLGNIQMTGDLHLDSEGDIFQVEGATLSVGGAAEFLAGTGEMRITQATNRFMGLVSFAGANGRTATNAEVEALGDLVLEATTLNNELTASATGDISQVGVLNVDVARLSAGTQNDPSNITLGADNLFSTLVIEQAANAHIKNTRALLVESAQVAESLSLEVDGNLTQGAEPFNVNQLLLNITNGTFTLLNEANVIGHLGGSVRDGELRSNGPLTLDDFAVTGNDGLALTLTGDDALFRQGLSSTFTSNGDVSIQAPAVALGDQSPLAEGELQPRIELMNNADLTFNQVLDFAFHGDITADVNNGEITVNGAEAAGEFRIGDTATWQANRFTLNSGGEADTLFAPNVDNQWTLQGDNSGEFTTAAGTVFFNGIEQLEGGAGIDQFSINGPLIATLNGNGGQDSITGSDNPNDWQLVSDGQHQLTSDGQTLTFIGVESIIGNQAGDTLTGTDSATHWLVESGSTGTVTPEDQEAILFSLMDRFTGGAGNDTFELAGDALNGVAGGEGDDTFLVMVSQSGTLQGDAGADQFIVGANDLTAHVDGGSVSPEDIDVLVGLSDQDNIWTITADGNNSLNSTVTYTNIERLQGTEANDTFTFEQGADITLQIAGGDGDGYDELNYSEIEGPLDVQLGDNLNQVSGIENILGNNHDASVLTILDGDNVLINDESYINTWLISEPNSGSVNLQRGKATKEVQFSQFANIKGQAVIDHFTFAPAGSMSGGIDGGVIDPAGITGGRNILTGTDQNTTWTIGGVHQVSLTYTDTGTLFLDETNNISHLVGGDGDDRFEYSINNSGVGAEGNEGNDIADFSNIADDVLVQLGGADVNGVSGVETLVGNAIGESAMFNSRVQIASFGDNVWQLNGANQGLVTLAGDEEPMAVVGFNQWVGGPGADTFELGADLTGAAAVIDGGGGDDLFTLNTVFTTDILGGAGDDVIQLTPTAEIRGMLNGNGGNNTLRGFDGDLTWRVIAVTTLGLISERIADGTERQLLAGATNIQRLQGGTGEDRFLYHINNSGVGASGGKGTDTANFSAIAADVEVTLGGLDVNGVSGVESVVGNNSGPQMVDGLVVDAPYTSTLSVISEGANTWQVTENHGGTVALAGDLGSMLFKGFNQLIGGTGDDSFVIGAGGKVETITDGSGQNLLDLRARTGQVNVNLLDGAVTADQLTMTVSGMGEVQATLEPTMNNALTGGASNRWLIDDTNAGQVLVNQQSDQTVLFSGFNTLIGGTGADDFELQVGGQVSTVRGAGGTNTLSALNTDNTWRIDGRNRGELVDSNEQRVTFIQMNNVRGGDGVDEFVLLGETSAITGSIEGGGGLNHIQGAPIATAWVVDPDGVGSSDSIGRFQSISTLTGGAGDDSFVLQSLAALTAIDGGAGHNPVDVSSIVDDSSIDLSLTLGLQAGDEPADLLLTDITDVVGSGDEVLVGADIDAAWRFTAPGEGYLESLDDTPVNVVFSGLGRVEAGTGDDLFIFEAGAALVNGVDGGLGMNSLQSAYDGNRWRLTGDNRGELLRGEDTLVFTFIENLTGGWGDDRFDLSATFAQLTGEIKGAPSTPTDEPDLGEDTLVGFNADSLWTIDQIAGGTIEGQMGVQTSTVVFRGIEHLLGQDQQDTFAFVGESQSATIAGLVSGGNPSGMDVPNPDVLDLTDYLGPFVINYGAPTAERVAINIAGIERIDTAPGHEGGLLAGNTDNRWEITELNSGRLCVEQSCTTFTDFASLIGGTGDDDFVLVNDQSLLTGMVDGGLGEGSNRLILEKSGSHLWQVTGNNSGVLVALGDEVEQPIAAFNNVAHLLGGDGADQFHFSAEAGVTSLDGGDGNNAAFFAERDYLVNLEGARFSVGVVAGNTVLEEGRRIQKLSTGDGNDVFVVSGPVLANAIAAGEGVNRLDAMGLERALSVNLNEGTSNIPVQGEDRALEATGFTEVLANSGFDNTLTALNHNATWAFSDDGAATIEYDSGVVIGFAGFNHVIGGNQADQFDLNNFMVASVTGGLGEDTLASGSLVQGEDQWLVEALNKGQLQKYVADAPLGEVAFTSIEHIVGGAGSDWVQLVGDARLSGSVDGGGGGDTLVSDLANQHWLLEGPTDAISGRLQDAQEQGVQHFAHFEVLQGSGSDTLTGPEQNSLWQITVDDGVAEGTVGNNDSRDEMQSAPTPVTFSGVTTLLGGNLDDRFELANEQALNGFIDGGAGSDSVAIGGEQPVMVNIGRTLDDTLNPSAIAPSFTVHKLAQIEDVVAPAELSSILLGPGTHESGYTWAITGAQKGTVNFTDASSKATEVGFQNFDVIYAGAWNDSFQIADGSDMGFIDGGDSHPQRTTDAVDFIDYSLVQEDIYIEVSGSLTSVGDISIVGFEGVVGNNDGAEHTEYDAVLAVADGNNRWLLNKAEHGLANGFNEGVIEHSGADSDTTMVFMNFNHLQGGSGVDQFSADGTSQITGFIRGGGGADSFDVQGLNSEAALNVFLNPTSAGIGFNLTGIEHLVGHGENAVLWGSDADNQWRLADRNQGSVTFADTTVTFEQFAHLRGGGVTDDFVVQASGVLDGWLYGGQGDDRVTLRPRLLTTHVAMADAESALVGAAQVNVQSDLEQVTAEGASALLQANGSTPPTWNITGDNTGLLGGVTFVGFTDLLGSQSNDQFVVGPGGAISGVIDGGLGANALNLEGAADAQTVSLASHSDAHWRARNIQRIAANADHLNTLIAGDGDNQWSIARPDEGSVSQALGEGSEGTVQQTFFEQFAHLRGGAGDDYFTVLVDGEIRGSIDGGGASAGDSDTVDFSEVGRALTVTLGDDPKLRYIERLVGNDQLQLFGPNNHAEWLLDGDNAGSVSAAEVNLRFSAISSITGGALNDTFTLRGGSLSDILRGGDGDDRLIVDLGTDALVHGSSVRFDGGEGQNRVRTEGRLSALEGQYQGMNPSLDPALAFAELRFTQAQDELTASQSVRYQNVHSVQQFADTQQMRFIGSAETDQFHLNNSTVAVNDDTAITFNRQSPNVVIDGDYPDHVLVDGVFNVANHLTINKSTVSATPDGVIKAPSLTLRDTQGFGAVNVDTEGNRTLERINADISNLSALNNTGGVYLHEANGLVLQAVGGSGELDILLSDGSLTQGTDLEASGAIAINALQGDIQLNGVNQLGGPLSLLAGRNIELYNQGDTQLAAVQAAHFALQAGGVVSATGAVKVRGLASLNGTHSMTFGHADNQFVEVQAQGPDIQLHSGTSLVVSALDIAGKSNFSSDDNLVFNGALSTQALTARADSGEVHLASDIMVSQGLELQGETVAIDGGIAADTLYLAGRSQVQLNKPLNVDGSIAIDGGQVLVNADMFGGGDTLISASDSIRQQAAITTASALDLQVGTGELHLAASGRLQAQRINLSSVTGDIILNGEVGAQAGIVVGAGYERVTLDDGDVWRARSDSGALGLSGQLTSETGDVYLAGVEGITMEPTAGVTAQTGDINLASLGNIALSQLIARQQTVNINTSGSVINNLGAASDNNVVAESLVVTSGDGFGAGDKRISTAVAHVALSNGSGTVAMENEGLLRVSSLHTDGDILLRNDRDVTLSSGSINAFYLSDEPLNPRANGEPTHGGDFDLFIRIGSMRTAGGIDVSQPAISARNVNVISLTGDFGGPGLPPVIYAPESMTVTALTSWNRPIWGFGIKPRNFTDNSQLKTNISQIGAGEQLVEVESLEQIDPAVFTDVKNYFYREISILLPEDQRYEDEL